jgi:hypothetical protein
MNLYQQKINYLSNLAEAFLQAEADNNPTLQNHLLRQMSYTADRLFLCVTAFLSNYKAEKEQEYLLKKQQLLLEEQNKAGFVCRYCHKRFTTVHALNGHSRVHRQPHTPFLPASENEN